jgi:hypothetical protein
MQEVERYKKSHKVSSENRKRGIMQQARQRRGGLKPKIGVAVTAHEYVDPVQGAGDDYVERAPTDPEMTSEQPPHSALEPLVMEVRVRCCMYVSACNYCQERSNDPCRNSPHR